MPYRVGQLLVNATEENRTGGKGLGGWEEGRVAILRMFREAPEARG